MSQNAQSHYKRYVALAAQRHIVIKELAGHLNTGWAPLVLEGAAKKGDPKAQYQLAIMYALGFGVKKDAEEAIWRLSESALRGFHLALGELDYYVREGYASAQNAMANIYLVGVLVPENTQKAESLYRKAAAQGHHAALQTMAALFVGREDYVNAWICTLASLGKEAFKNGIRPKIRHADKVSIFAPEDIASPEKIAEIEKRVDAWFYKVNNGIKTSLPLEGRHGGLRARFTAASQELWAKVRFKRPTKTAKPELPNLKLD